MRSLLLVLHCSILMFCCSSAWAQKPQNITPGEWALAPEFCQDVQGFRYGDQYFNTSPRAGHWVGLMGDSFWHMHHYCWALINLMRAKNVGVSPSQKRAFMVGAAGDFGYVIRNARPDFVMLPEVWTRLGDVQLQLGEPGAAMQSYQSARKIKPDYWPPYVRWAEVLEKIGKHQEAKSLMEDILRITPEEPVVREQYKRFGGDPLAFVRKLPPPASIASGSGAASAAAAASTPAPAASQ